MCDGIKSLPNFEQRSISAKKLRDFYSFKPDAEFYQTEFGYYVLEKWVEQGFLKPEKEVADYDAYLREIFGYDKPAICSIGGLGWCEAGFYPKFEEEVLEDRGNCELVRDYAGRKVLFFKGSHSGYMPEYVDHPVKDFMTWEKDVKWRLDPNAAGRELSTAKQLKHAADCAKNGDLIVQRAIGGYMYLRSMIGPEELAYMFYDDPKLIRDCMETWFKLSDSVIASHQAVVSFDELFIAEDICYNHGSLISPDMTEEFLLPYYQQLYTNMKKRNIDQARTLHFQVDTDGYCGDVIELYKSVGADSMSPFEVASGSDVVTLGAKYPDLLISGGIDKRILAESKEAIDRHLEYIMPAMKKRGGYIPTCDHGVPEEVSFENYMHYRKRMAEYER